jgi:hypothetical protein
VLSKAALLELLFDHLVHAAADLSMLLARSPAFALLSLMSSSVSSSMFVGLKLGGNARGGKSWNVITNAPTSSCKQQSSPCCASAMAGLLSVTVRAAGGD